MLFTCTAESCELVKRAATLVRRIANQFVCVKSSFTSGQPRDAKKKYLAHLRKELSLTSILDDDAKLAKIESEAITERNQNASAAASSYTSIFSRKKSEDEPDKSAEKRRKIFNFDSQLEQLQTDNLALYKTVVRQLHEVLSH